MRFSKIRIVALAATLFGAAAVRAEIKEETVAYKDGDTELEGVVVYDDASQEARPGVLIIHQWMGLTDHEKAKARQLARQGYVAFAADIYGKGVKPASPADAGKEAGKYKGDAKLLRSRTAAALAALKARPGVDANKIAAIGFCFGGAAALEMARANMDLAGVVSFHGSYSPAGSPAGGGDPADGSSGGAIKPKILVLHGADDPHATRDQLAEFMKEMDARKADYQVILYSGAVHGFTQESAGADKSKGVAYDEAADRRSWAATRQFFGELFGDQRRRGGPGGAGAPGRQNRSGRRPADGAQGGGAPDQR